MAFFERRAHRRPDTEDSMDIKIPPPHEAWREKQAEIKTSSQRMSVMRWLSPISVALTRRARALR
jgi:hypothetical protein